jgi:hypothetical protein
MARAPRWVVLAEFGIASDRIAADLLGQHGEVAAVIAEPVSLPEAEALRDAVLRAALEEDFGDLVLAGVAFAPAWGGDAIGFT